MKNPKLSDEQRAKLAILEPMLMLAATARDYEKAKDITLRIQNILRPTGHEMRLMQAKNRLFEIAMESGNINIAISGFTGIRQKVSKRTRLYLEATTLLAICYLRKQIETNRVKTNSQTNRVRSCNNAFALVECSHVSSPSH